ncbi:MAG: DUF2975 domain-containing protein [Oscillospiraceae bacterium]|nr:DUF2975 domain-containing protein [Oscillospiraceae bacterium]
MKSNWNSDKSLLLTRILTIAVLFLAGAALFCIPVITEWYDAVSEQKPIHTVLNIVLYASDLFGIFGALQLHRLLLHISKKKLFVQENVTCFRLISWCCFGVAALWAVLTFWRRLALFVALIAAFAGLILRVLKNLLEQAVELREENDYTI